MNNLSVTAATILSMIFTKYKIRRVYSYVRARVFMHACASLCMRACGILLLVRTGAGKFIGQAKVY